LNTATTSGGQRKTPPPTPAGSWQLAEALRQLQAGELAHEYAPSEEDLERARRELGQAPPQQDT
jgi:hypothetical protein